MHPAMDTEEEAFKSTFTTIGVVDNNSSRKLLKVCDGTKSATFRDPEQFNEIALEYIKSKLDSTSKITDMWNHWQIYKALNVIYLDGDLYYDDELDDENIENSNTEIAAIYYNEVVKVFGEPINYFIFIPIENKSDTGKKKGGFHCMLFYDKEFKCDGTREEKYNAVKLNMLNNSELIEEIRSYGIEVDSTNFEKVFDNGPIKTTTLLMPFAVKPKNPRSYRLIDWQFNDPNLFVIPVTHAVSNQIEYDGDERLEIEDYEFTYDESNLSSVTRELLQFLRSLKYMSMKSNFWVWLSDHNNRFLHVYSPIVNFIFGMELIMGYGKYSFEEMKRIAIEMTLKYISPLVKLTVRDGEQTDRATTSSILKHIQECLNKSFESGGYFEYTFHDGEYRGHLYSMVYSMTKNASKIQRTSIIRNSKILTIITGGLDKGAEANRLLSEFMGEFNRTINRINNIITRISKLVTIISDSFTNEIMPFKSVDIITPGEDIRAGVTFDSDQFDEKFYDQIIGRWLKFFVVFCFYNSYKSNVDAFRSAINILVKRFVYKLDAGGRSQSYIYNFRQFKAIRVYPYNQWLPDHNELLIMEWFSYIYNRYVANQFKTESKPGFVDKFLEFLTFSNALKSKCELDILPMTNFDKEIKQVSANIVGLSTFNYTIAQPRLIPSTDDSCWFPMRNGLLEFVLHETGRVDGKKRGDVVFHDENYTRIMNVQTNITWNPYYSTGEDNIAYHRILRMLEDMKPETDEREYILKIYAQCLHSIGQRDQVHQHYGTGAEGKSLLNHLMLVTLGYMATQTISVQNGDYDAYSIFNPLSETLKAEALIQQNEACHDSGGIVELIDKRFVTIQEPITMKNGKSVKIDTSTIKALTGGSFMKGRRIYKEAESFRPKVFTTMQTNREMGFNEVDTAIVRRTKTIYFKVKFLSESTATKPAIPSDNKNVKRADPDLARSIDNDVSYWEAFFHILLPYAQEFIREGRSGLSDIPCPLSIIKQTEHTISRSNGVMMWLAANLIENSKMCISLDTLIGRIDSYYSNTKHINGIQNQDYDRDMAQLSRQERIDMICSSLMGRFAAHHLYKLRDEFWDEELDLFHKWRASRDMSDDEILNSDGDVISYPPSYPAKIDDDESTPLDMSRWLRYFDPTPINNIYTMDQKYLNTREWQQRIYIIGYEIVTDHI